MSILKKIVLFCLFCPIYLFAQVDFRNPYSVENIPVALLKGANVVVRDYRHSFLVKNKGEAIEEEHKVITLLNDKAAAEYSEPIFHYSKLIELTDIQAVVYDANGKKVKALKQREIEDFKPYELYVNDARYKKIKLPHLPYPYTIEYTVKTKHNGLLFYPVFIPQQDGTEAVENATFDLQLPEGLEARVKEINVPAGAKTSANHWSFKDIAPMKEENYMPNNQQVSPLILTAPNDFTLEGYQGNMRTWKDLGLFIYQLNQGRNTLSPAFITELNTLVKDCTDDYCKIQKIYELLQNSTRYFYVGLGIGGWQPAAAADVHTLKYGDCKGLSNYTVSMLNAVGVPACYVLIRAGDTNRTQYPDFPNAYFNHAIACVPMEKDTLWLECTSQTESCGFLSNFTDSRYALLVTPQGGKLVKTPQYNETINRTEKTTRLKINANGSANVQSEAVFTGTKEALPAQLAETSNEVKKKYLYKELNINDFELKKLELERKKGRFPSVTQRMELEIGNLVGANGKRLFIPVNLLSKWTDVPAQDTLRCFPVQADGRGFSESDNISISLPEGYQVESQPTATNLLSPFGNYSLTFKLDGTTLLVTRKLVLNNSIQPKEKATELAIFLKNISKADNAKMVLVKK
jgi:hypothetical protein